MKKKFIIFISIILILFLSFIFVKNLSKEKINDKDFMNLTNDSIFANTIIVNKEKKQENLFNKETEKDSIYIPENNKYKVNINEENVEIDLGYLFENVISFSNIKLKDNYFIIEFLLGKKNNLEYLNDSQLSTTYDSVLNYSKIWFLYDIKTKNYYKIIDTSNDLFLFLNPKIIEDNLEFDYMAKSGPEKTIANHYKINIDELINKILNGNYFDYYNYSTLENNKFELLDENKIKTINTKLNNQNLEINIYEKYENSKNSYSGFSLKINDIKKDIKMDFPSTNIAFINLKENLTGIVLTSYTTGIQDYQTIIYTFINNEFIEVLNIREEIDEFIFDENNNEININKQDNYFLLTLHKSDFIQEWTLEQKYILNDNNKLQLVKEKYYTAKEIISSISNRDIYIYMDNDYNAEKILLPSGSKVEFIGTDLNYWGVIRYNGQTYYLAIDNDGNIKDLNIPAIAVFNDLIYGD